jgi:deazaflavin-dependent oxidoreductase (nitroreductase family)
VNEEALRQAFKYFNRFMLFLWRLGLGPWLSLWPEVGGRYMIITHTGRKSGQRRQTPVNYAVVDDEVYCTAGFGSTSDWYRNIKANPQIEVWLQDGWWAGEAEEITSPELRLPLLRAVIIASGFAGPLFGVDAHQIDDQQLAKATQDYRLIHIRRAQARTGPGGPGDLAWVWPLATFLMLPFVFRRKRRKSR